MKKLILLFFVSFLTIIEVNAQRDEGYFKAGAVAGIPIGDIGDDSSFMLGADVSYVFPNNSDRLLNYSLSAGLRNYFLDDIAQPQVIDQEKDALFLPLYGGVKIELFGAVSGGVDVGYAFGMSDYLDGGFYFRPIVSFDVFDQLELNFAYESVSDQATWSSLMIGALFKFKN